MISLEAIKNFFPAYLQNNAWAHKHLLKEYIQLMILDYLSSTPYIRKLIFIGGTCIRLTKGIDRFSEYLDFMVDYPPQIVNVKVAGFFFPLPVPSDAILCAMKVSALLDRQKGRDFYDAMFLLSQTLPDFNFLKQRSGISNLEMLKNKAAIVFQSIDLRHKMKDFEHLLFNKENSKRILHAPAFFNEL